MPVRWRADRGRWQIDHVPPVGPRVRKLAPPGATREEAEALLRDLSYGVDVGQSESFASVAERWYVLRSRTWARSTCGTYRDVLDLHVLPVIGHLHVAAITARELEALLDEVQSRSPGQMTTVTTIMGSVMRYARRRGYVERLPTDDLEHRPAKRPPPRYLTRDEYARVLDAAPSQQLRDAIVVGVRTGMRVGEIVALRGSDWQGDAIIVQRQYERHGAEVKLPKGGRIRSVPVHPDVAEILLRRPRGDEYVWESSRLHRWSWLPLGWRVLARRLGIRDGTHLLRHTFASWWVQGGWSIQVLQKMLGHANISTTMRYAHMATDTASLEAIRAWGGVGTSGTSPGDTDGAGLNRDS